MDSPSLKFDHEPQKSRHSERYSAARKLSGHPTIMSLRHPFNVWNGDIGIVSSATGTDRTMHQAKVLKRRWNHIGLNTRVLRDFRRCFAGFRGLAFILPLGCVVGIGGRVIDDKRSLVGVKFEGVPTIPSWGGVTSYEPATNCALAPQPRSQSTLRIRPTRMTLKKQRDWVTWSLSFSKTTK